MFRRQLIEGLLLFQDFLHHLGFELSSVSFAHDQYCTLAPAISLSSFCRPLYFSHLYVDYYVFQYATGISAANALAQRVRSGDPAAAEAYLNFLKAGGSLYPLDALKLAGVDMATPAPVEAAFEVLAGIVTRLEKLVAE